MVGKIGEWVDHFYHFDYLIRYTRFVVLYYKKCVM